MAIIVRNIGSDPVALANAVAQNLATQSTTENAGFFHADSTSNGQVPDLGYNIPQVPGTGVPASQLTTAQANALPGLIYGGYVTQSPAVDLLSAQQLAMALAGSLIGSGTTTDPPAHFYDAPNSIPASIVGAGAHKAQDSVNTNLLSSVQTFAAAGGIGGASQTATNTFLNAIQTSYNAHRTQSGVHYSNDTTNVSAAAAASNLATSITLANDLLNRINAHVGFYNVKYPQIRVIAP